MTDSSTDWDEVKNFYLACRSYKQTAEHFGMNEHTVRARARRGKWSVQDAHSGMTDVHSVCNVSVQDAHSGMTDAHSVCNMSVQDAHSDMADAHSVCNVSVQDVHSDMADAHSVCNVSVQDAHSDMANAHSVCNVSVQDVHSDMADAHSVCNVSVQDEHSDIASFPSFLLPCLSNFQAQAVQMLSPWNVQVRPRDSFSGDKNAFKTYLIDAKTEDCLYSGIIGLVPQRRVSRENKPTRLLAIVADYDTKLDDATRKRKLSKLPIPPNYISVSFSGGTHAIWFMERPLPLMPDAESNNALLRSIVKDLKLNRAFGTLDERAFYNLAQIYTAGKSWQHVSNDPIPAGRCELWIRDAIKSIKSNNSTSRIPLERVKVEIDKRFPGRWEGEFVPGARGVRFWDPAADNPTAAIVTEGGMVCFTGDFAFRSWSDIFGVDFARDYAAETIGQAIADIYYIGREFWRKSDSGDWVCYPRRELNDILQNEYGLNSRSEDGKSGSEVSQAISAIATRKALHGRIPFIYNDEDVVEIDGKKFLNTSRRRALSPGKFTQEWGDGFPWIADFLIRLFGREDAEDQLDFFISWLAHAYKGALNLSPTRGQAIYIAGQSGSGKSFLSKHIIAPLFGGREEATSYLMNETRFNNALFDSGIWNIDDAEVIAEPRAHARYSALVKKVVANDDFLCEAKYVNAVKVPWKGRLVVTCNTDPESLRILPAIDINNSDKLMFFLCTDSVLDDPDCERRVREELPAFAGFLATYEMPEYCRGSHRFGVRSFLHPILMVEASNSGISGTFQDVFCVFLKNYFEATNKDELRGSASEIYEQMCGIDTMRELMKGLVTPSSIGKRLGMLASKADFPLTYGRTTKQRCWIVKRDQFEKYYSANNVPTSFDDDENCPF